MRLGRLWPIVFAIALSGCGAFSRAVSKLTGSEFQPPLTPQDNPQIIIIEKMWWMLPVAIIVGAAAAFLFVQGKIKWAVGLAAAAIVAIGLSITVFSNFALIGWIALGVGCLGLVVAIYVAWANSRAVPELIETHEFAKDEMTTNGRAVIHGNGDGDHGKAGCIQSPTTERIVKRVRAKLDKAKRETEC